MLQTIFKKKKKKIIYIMYAAHIYCTYTSTCLETRSHLEIFDGREDRGQITTVGLVTLGGDA